MLKDGVVNVVPTTPNDPVPAASYQYKVPPATGFAVNVTDPVPHLLAPVTVGATGGVVFCVIVLLAVAVQPFALVTTTLYVPGTLTLNVDTFPGFVTPLGTVHV